MEELKVEPQTRLSVPGVWFGKRWKGKQAKSYPASVVSELERDKKGARVFEVLFDEDEDFDGEYLYEMRWDAVDKYRVDGPAAVDGLQLESVSDAESPKPTPRSAGRPRTPTHKKAEEIADRADKQAKQLKSSGLKEPSAKNFKRNRGTSDRGSVAGPAGNEDEIRQALRALGGKGLVGRLARGVQGKQSHADYFSESSGASDEDPDRKDTYQEQREAPRLMGSMLRYHRTVYDWVLNGTDFKNPRKRHEALVLAMVSDTALKWWRSWLAALWASSWLIRWGTMSSSLPWHGPRIRRWFHSRCCAR